MGTNKTTMNEFKRYVEEGADSSNTFLKTLLDIERKFRENIDEAVTSMKNFVESFPSHSFEGASLRDLENLVEQHGINPVGAGLIYSFVAIKASQETNRIGDNNPKWAITKLFKLARSITEEHVRKFLVQLMITLYETAYGDVSDASVVEESAYTAYFVAISCVTNKDYAIAKEYSDKSIKLLEMVTCDPKSTAYHKMRSNIYKTAGICRRHSGDTEMARELLLEALAAAENISGEEKDKLIASIKKHLEKTK